MTSKDPASLQVTAWTNQTREANRAQFVSGFLFSQILQMADFTHQILVNCAW